MRSWPPQRIAAAAGARLAAGPFAAPGPTGASIDSREVAIGDLFIGLPGEHHDGGAFATAALGAGAWGVMIAPEHEQAVLAARLPGVVLVHSQPLLGMQTLARAWRDQLGARVVAVTGSTGKTSTKDITAALLGRDLRTVASLQNLNTEIGLPLVLLRAPKGTQALVLEMGMRGAGQIAQLTAIARPDVGVIVNIGPVHLQQMGSLEGVAAAKAELIAGMAPGGTAVLPAGEPLLDAHRRADLHTVTFGDGGDVSLAEVRSDGEVIVRAGEHRHRLRPSFDQAHNLHNLLAAVAAARALGLDPQGDLDVTFSELRGERVQLPGGVLVVNDCYNANPMSVAAALDELVRTAPGRRVAVLGDMLELGPDELEFHRAIGALADRAGVDVLVAVGSRAAAMADTFPRERHRVADAQAAGETTRALLRDGDTVLVKGSRGVGLQTVLPALAAAMGASPGAQARSAAAPSSSPPTQRTGPVGAVRGESG